MEEKIKIVYVVTSYGRVIGVFADQKDALDVHVKMLRVNKGQLAELVPMTIIYPGDLKSHE